VVKMRDRRSQGIRALVQQDIASTVPVINIVGNLAVCAIIAKRDLSFSISPISVNFWMS
jgi:hypothetical protein